ncbi:DeoR/GlpR family DNA-binding transcription regulator [Pantoea endophytica]|uniref:DeoR/GlpR family DNA-binding transcription regulator n=1 Tax=Pantoea endophytica TaxID=92488 RepID=UPI003018C2B4
MSQEERLIEIERILKFEGKITLESICNIFQISKDSARRDLVKVTLLPNVVRIRGGAIYSEARKFHPYLERVKDFDDKILLCQRAASLLRDNDVVFFDAGSTSAQIAGSLSVSASVITNSLDVLNALVTKEHVSLTVLGGSFDHYSHTIESNTTLDQISNYHADVAFIGVSAISDSGITTGTEIDALVKKKMASNSERVVCVMSSKKFNSRLMFQSCSWEDIDQIITDELPPDNIAKLIELHDVQLTIIGKIDA